MKTLKKQLDANEALQYAAGVCARSEQCEHDIRMKLSGRGLSAVEIDSIIDYLCDNRYIDEARYARSFSRDKARFNGWGRIKIRMHLAARKIGRDAIEAGLAEIDEDEYRSRLLRLARSLSTDIDVADYASRMKLLRRLTSRGFEPALASQAIARLAR